MSQNESDQAFEKLHSLIDKVVPTLSESDTRAKIIDPLFKDCLGWTEKDILREPHIHKDYLDYIFSIGKFRKFVLEAKKVGQSFAIPDSFSGRTYKISGTISTNRKIIEAIEQTQEYCINSGVRYGVVSNGNQYILFEAFKHGANWRDGQCIIFRSLKDIERNFLFFWNVLNRESVRQGSLRKYISQEHLPLEFMRPLDKVHSKDAARTRNNMSPLLQPLIEHVFKDIIDESQLDVLRKCYVTQRQYQSAGLQISRHFDRPPDFAKKFQVKAIWGDAIQAGDFQKRYDACEEFLRTTAPKGSLILLMGGIGSGKTTFLHHFFNFVIKRPSLTLWFYIDFTKATPEPEKIEEHIFQSIVHDFERRYRDRLKEELASIGLNSISPDLKSIKVLFTCLTLKGYTISIVLDNADQHSYVSPEYQERTLLVAKYLTEELKTITILTLREESFFRSTMSGVLDALPLPVFHLSSPRFETLIRYRINYVLGLLKKDDEEIRAATRSEIQLGSAKSILEMFFQIIENSLRSARPVGRRILMFINDISGGDMRTALRFFTTFLVSGNTDVDEMLGIENRQRELGEIGYQIPLHHVIRSIMLEHSMLYSSSRSRIMNLFNVNPEHTSSHFVHLRILNYLYRRLTYQPTYGRGFVPIDSVMEEAEDVSINTSAIADSLITLARFGLVEFENQSKEGYKTATHVRITNTGIYYLEELVYQFQYLDLVWMDTPISEKKLVPELLRKLVEFRAFKTDQDRAHALDERFERTKLFLNYLKEMEERELKNNPEFQDSDLAKEKFMPKIIEESEDQIDYIKIKRQSQAINFSD